MPSPPLSLHELSELKRENQDFQKALTKAVSNLKELSHYSEYIHRPLDGIEGEASAIHPLGITKAKIERPAITMQMRATQAMQEEYEALISDLSAQVRVLKQEAAQKEMWATQEAASIEKLSQQLRETTREIDARTRALTECMGRIQELESIVAEQTRVVLTKETERAQIDAELLDLRRRVHVAESAKDKLVDDHELLTAGLERERQARCKAEKRNKELETKMQVLHAQCAALEQSQAAFTTVDAERRKDMALVAEQLEETKEMLRRVQTEMTARMARREARISRLKVAIFDMTQEKELRERRIHDLTRQLQETTANNDSLEQLLAVARHDNRCAVRHAATKTNIEAAGEETGLERARCDLLGKEVARLREQLASAQDARREDAFRHAQELLGKTEEAAYVWQKYMAKT
ncbi:Aste57867_1085 [Aphanomyces stellatus]|uniref:Aste57867_1085 protein n=1 Tax=Aphanomyces stellatus TaxID=120398 RepID=A0A485K4R9_9STRA|nr:hypothetical protein As57867_001084 [Aphanomyces stellatus]VFT78307.1 Aste57867_1085 [Aphanomyces stellatus]